MFREGSNVAIHIIDNIVLEGTGLVYDELAYIAEKLHKNAMWKNLSTKSFRPRHALEYVEELMGLCSVQPVLQVLKGNSKDGADEIMENLLGPQSPIDWRICFQCMKKEHSFGPYRSVTGSGRHDAHLLFVEATGLFLFIELTPAGKVQTASFIEKETNGSAKSRNMTTQILINFLLHLLWQSL